MLMKQETKRVEWYHGDFSDPEAVSGSSTSLTHLCGDFCCEDNIFWGEWKSFAMYEVA